MKNGTKLLALLLALTLCVGLFAGCGNSNTGTAGQIEEVTQTAAPTPAADGGEAVPEVVYERADDEDVYESILGDYPALMDAAKAAASNDERFVRFAQAEATLLDSGTFIPTTTRGGVYSISRIAPHTKPYVQWGNDDDRRGFSVISDEFITKEEYADLMDLWRAALAGEGEYDPAAYLTEKGHTLQTTYTYTFSTAPVTLDWLNTSSQSDTEVTVNCVDGLVEYDNLNRMNPALAESWDISDDGTVYTFHIRPGVYWYTSEGTQYAEVTAYDFEAGFHHMLDTQAGLEWLIDGIVVGGTDYYANGGNWDDVGYKAIDDYTLEVTLEQDTPYFMTMLTYSCFLPLCKSFYEAHGGVYGVDEYATAFNDTNAYTFGKSTDVSSQVYNGAFLLRSFNKDSEILLVKNPNYYRADEVTIETFRWVYDNGENPTASYNDCVGGTYPSILLRESNGTLALAKADGNFDKYSFVTDTESTTYFGGLNLNRGTYALENGACASPKTEQQKIDTHTALQNEDFRKAVLFAFGRLRRRGPQAHLPAQHVLPPRVRLPGGRRDRGRQDLDRRNLLRRDGPVLSGAARLPGHRGRRRGRLVQPDRGRCPP